MRHHRLWSCGLLLLPCLTGCQTGPAKGPGAGVGNEPVALQVAEAREEKWPRVLRVQGSLFADEHAILGAKVAGIVKEVKVDLGSIVKEGDVLAILCLEDFDLQVAQAEAHVKQSRAKLGLKPNESEDKLDPLLAPLVREEQAAMNDAKLKLERNTALARQKAIPAEELQLQQSAFAVAEARYQSSLNAVEEQLATLGMHRAELGLARQRREDGTIRARFSGIIEHRHVAPGVYVQAGAPIVNLVRTNPLRFHAGVPERQAMDVRLGQPVYIDLEGESKPLEGRITRISPSVSAASRSLAIEVDVPNPNNRLRTGLFAEAGIVIDPNAKTLSVPEKALTEFAGVEKVWLVRNGEARECTVQTGRRESGRVEILGGLRAGDVIAADARVARAGPVEILPTAQRVASVR